MKFIDSKNLKGFILNNANQVDIMSYYLGISEMDIHYCLQDSSRKVKNTLRIDNNPSIGFMERAGIVRMKDFARDEYSGDCFHVAGIRLGLDSNEPKEFIAICKDIINKIILDGYQKEIWNKPATKEHKFLTEPRRIEIEVRDWTPLDEKVWSPYGLTLKDLNYYKVYPVYKANIKNYKYYYQSHNKCYAYDLGVDRGVDIYELYMIDRKRPYRFITNNKLPIKKGENISSGDALILSKSVKDYMVLDKILQSAKFASPLFLNGELTIHHSIISTESIRLNRDLINEILSRYKTIVIFHDYDDAGMDLGQRYSEVFESFHTNDLSNKDIADYRKNKGLVETVKLFNKLMNKITTKLK